MNNVQKNILRGVLVITTWLLMYGFYYQSHKGEVLQKAKLAALLAESPTANQHQLSAPIKFSDCQVRGPLPDPDCTPGDTFSAADPQTICVSGYTKTVRNVSDSTRKKVYAMYQISYPPAKGSYELDHLIPLALGGNNDVANLFPEAAQPYPGFKEKDVVEVYLYQEVCAGHIDVASAQLRIASNWVQIYNTLDPETIQSIRQKYKSWAN